MTKHDFYNLAFKLVGLYFFVMFFTGMVQFIIYIFGAFQFDSSFEFWLFYGGITINLLFYLFFGYSFIFKTEIVSQILKIDSDKKTIKMAIDKIDLFELALVVISVIAITFSIPRILANLTDIIYFPSKDEFGNFSKSFDVHSYAMIFQLTIGIFILLNARNFSKMINRRGIKDDAFDENNSGHL